MSRRNPKTLAVCKGCHRPFVTELHLPFDGQTDRRAWHGKYCRACDARRSAAAHLEAAKRMAAKAIKLDLARSRNAAEFRKKHPENECELCAEGVEHDLFDVVKP